MTAVDTIRQWIAGYSGHDILSEFSVDYMDRIPASGAVFPSGLLEVSRTNYVDGGVLVENQYNFGLYYVFEKAPGDDVGAEKNADWIMDFQEWIQDQSLTGNVPLFGTRTTAVRAQNGALYEADVDGMAVYMVQLSVTFEKEFEVNKNG